MIGLLVVSSHSQKPSQQAVSNQAGKQYAEDHFHHRPARLAWVLANVMPRRPVPARPLINMASLLYNELMSMLDGSLGRKGSRLLSVVKRSKVCSE
jgi:hypothetical protein